MYVVCCSFGRLVFVAVYTGGGQVEKAQIVHYTVDLLHYYTKYRLKIATATSNDRFNLIKLEQKNIPLSINHELHAIFIASDLARHFIRITNNNYLNFGRQMNKEEHS